ncbi:hypothetical protein NQ315_011840 [Exocentrus adspersus]|uniref:Ras-related protein Rab-26 n=1 Tax=Exocentrus adspersus TaxID=1586481 RepID=A0AAV8W0Z6_9CUCU|nr:hypothetical protein NQ315_011840 [Exocentrus adspersus]
MATDDSMDDDVFESQDDESHLKVASKPEEPKSNTPSPTGYRNYQPPAEVLKLCQTDIIDEVEPIIHKVRGKYRACNEKMINRSKDLSLVSYRPWPALKVRLGLVFLLISPVSLQTILLGDSGVGKTSLLVKFDTGKFQSGNFSATVGIGFTVSC